MSIVERIRALPPTGQLPLAGAAAAVIALLLGGLYFATRPDYDVLFSDLRQADAATIVAELEKDKVPYRLDDGGATILAPADRIDQIRLEIMGADLPLKGTVGFELFNKSDMGVTEFAQRINYQRAIQGELARTIMTIDAIDTARVHLTLPEPSIFRAERKPAKASVTLVTRPGRVLERETVAGIQRLVAASVPDLEPTSVVILDAHGSLAAGVVATAASTPETATSASVHQTRAVEQFYVAALRRALDPLYPGARIAVVAPADQWAAAPEERDAALASWRPGSRDFRLRVEIATPSALSQNQQDDIGLIVAEEIGWSAERGDLLVFPPWSAAGEAVLETAEAVPSSQPTAADTSVVVRPTPRADPYTFAWIAGVLVALGAAVLLLSRRKRAASGALTAAEREAYVRRLRRLLAEDAGHVG